MFQSFCFSLVRLTETVVVDILWDLEEMEQRRACGTAQQLRDASLDLRVDGGSQHISRGLDGVCRSLERYTLVLTSSDV